MGERKKTGGSNRNSIKVKIAEHERKRVGTVAAVTRKAETGQQSPRQRPDGDRRSDDGKPKDKVSDTVRNMAAGEPARKFIVGQQVFLDFLR